MSPARDESGINPPFRLRVRESILTSITRDSAPSGPASLISGTGDIARHETEYSGRANLEVLEGAVKYRRYLAELLHSVLPSGATRRCAVLDFGAGLGTYAREARAAGCEVVCVEVDGQLRESLRDDGFICYGSLRDLATASLDVVYSFNVLEHIDDDRSVLDEFQRVLRPGGKLLLYVPAFMILFGPMDQLVGHLRRYRRLRLSALVTRAGFRVEASRYADSLGFVAALVYRFSSQKTGRLDARSIAVYDRYLFPLSRVLDRVCFPFLGKNVVLVARR